MCPTKCGILLFISLLSLYKVSSAAPTSSVATSSQKLNENSVQSSTASDKTTLNTDSTVSSTNSESIKGNSVSTDNSLKSSGNKGTDTIISNAIVPSGTTATYAQNSNSNTTSNTATESQKTESLTDKVTPTPTTTEDPFGTNTEDPFFITTTSTTTSIDPLDGTTTNSNGQGSGGTGGKQSADIPTLPDGRPCSAVFKKVENMKNAFRVATSDGLFSRVIQYCPPGLHWRDDQCRCDYPKQAVDVSCKCCNRGFMKSIINNYDYKILINGQWVEASCRTQSPNMVWNEEICSCDWDRSASKKQRMMIQKQVEVPRYNTECVTLLNMSLDSSFKDEQSKHIKKPLRPRILMTKKRGTVNGGMQIRKSPFEIPAFRNNDLTKNFYLSFRFRVAASSTKSDHDMFLFTNGCNNSPPSFAVKFNPRRRILTVLFSTQKKSVEERLKPRVDAKGWYTVELYLQDKVLTIIVNNEKLYESNGMRGTAKSTSCDLRVAGSTKNPSMHFSGYLDEILIVKQCEYAKIKKQRQP